MSNASASKDGSINSASKTVSATGQEANKEKAKGHGPNDSQARGAFELYEGHVNAETSRSTPGRRHNIEEEVAAADPTGHSGMNFHGAGGFNEDDDN